MNQCRFVQETFNKADIDQYQLSLSHQMLLEEGIAHVQAVQPLHLQHQVRRYH